MSVLKTVLEVSGAIFWLSLGGGGAWLGLCAWIDARKARREQDEKIARIERRLDRRWFQKRAITARQKQEREALLWRGFWHNVRTHQLGVMQ